MIQDIYPHTFSNDFKSHCKTSANDYVFAFKGNSVLLNTYDGCLEIPQRHEFIKCSGDLYLFELNGKNCFLASDFVARERAGCDFYEVNLNETKSQVEIDWATSVAFQLKNWYEQNCYCGKCGKPTTRKSDERAIVCPSCDFIKYPSISPAVIVAILCDDKILMARGVNFKQDFHSLVAGYVDVGESIESAVRREVKEEVGLDISNIRYYSSQPWPFSGSLMIGFIAEADANQPIKIEEAEIAAADWFRRGALPNYPPQRSIAGEIIEKFEKGEL